MLIIAIPKSASTSLLHTLGEIHDFKSQQDFVSITNNPVPSGFKLLGKYHGDCREMTSQLAEKWIASDKFYKQHIPPTKNNLDLLHPYKKVILLREPRDIILAYRRAEHKGIHQVRTEFQGCDTENDWLNRAQKIGFYDELSRFSEGWKKAPTDKLLVHFEDLISDEKEVLETVSNYFDLPISDNELNNLNLKKFRYSRHNTIQKYVHKIVSRFQKIISH